jgi:quercetin dioxygenase-like cupin family protein
MGWRQQGRTAPHHIERARAGRYSRRDNGEVAGFDELWSLPLRRIWDGVDARVFSGERLSFGVVELEPGAVVPEHRHEHEQLGMVLSGRMSFRIGEESRELGPGETWTIPSNAPHEATAGPDGAVVIDVFAPVRGDWASLEAGEPRSPRWP